MLKFRVNIFGQNILQVMVYFPLHPLGGIVHLPVIDDVKFDHFLYDGVHYIAPR